jgi:16S rRNA (guanine527-N7)-methyltransferase
MAADPRPALSLPSPPPLVPPAGFAESLAESGIELPQEALPRLGDYLARLLAMNEEMNLTAITDPTEAWERHVFDALTLLPFLAELPAGATLADVGSGGGVPGIPVAIARPDLAVTLIEATQKKAAFLSMVAKALGLEGVTVLAERAEHAARGPLAGRFDVVTARAVGKLVALVPITAPLASPGGLLLLIKGQRAEEELSEAKKVLDKAGVIHELTVPTPTGRIVILRREESDDEEEERAPKARRPKRGR